MNWLMYIGGGIAWILFAMNFMRLHYKKEDFDWAVMLIWIMTYLMIWIWICWRFIQ